MRTINYYKVGILKNGESYFEQTEVGVALENDQWIVLDFRNFDKVTKDKNYEHSYPRIGVHRIWKRDNETGYFSNHREWGNGVFYKLYSETKKRPSTIRKEIEAFLEEKFGYLASIDLSFIK